MADFLSSLISETYRAAAESGIKVEAKTNVSPTLTLYDAADTSPSLLDTLGIRTYIRVSDKSGRTLIEYGEPVSINPLLVALYGGIILLSITAIGAGIGSLIRR